MTYKKDSHGEYRIFNGHRFHCAGGANTAAQVKRWKSSKYFCTRVTKNTEAGPKYVLWLGPRKKNAPK